MAMQTGKDDIMRSKLLQLEKQRDKYDVKYETSRFEDMVGFGQESAFEAKQRELAELNAKKLEHDARKYWFFVSSGNRWNGNFMNLT